MFWVCYSKHAFLNLIQLQLQFVSAIIIRQMVLTFRICYEIRNKLSDFR
jgi:hypothetical protein